MANAQKKQIPDFTLQEIYYHLFQWFVDLGRAKTKYMLRMFSNPVVFSLN
jgi:hypothetical protein